MVLAITVIQEFAIAEVEVNLYPTLRVGNGPETVGTQMNLGDGLGIGAFDKRSDGEQIVAHHQRLFSTSNLKEKALPTQVGIALLQIHLMVGMYGTHHIHCTR